MRMLMCIIALTLCGFSNDCSAGDRGKGVKFRCVTPGDVLLGAGVFLHDTGENVIGGVSTTVRGLGEVITAPLRARICIPQPRLFYFEFPTLRYKPGRFYRLVPPASDEPPARLYPPAAPTERLHFDHLVPLKHIPHDPSKHASFA
jgi:hypothetical protein